MSEYAYVQGEYEFPDDESLDATVEQLETWIDADESEWVDRDESTVQIPFGHYRNLHRKIEQIGREATYYHIVGACSDGIFYGFVSSTGDYTEADLDVWAEDNGFGDPPEGDFEEYVEWSEDVMEEFIKNQGGYIGA